MERPPRWIARVWEGSTRASDGDAYLDYLGRTGLPGYRATPGNRGVLGFRRVGPTEASFLLLTLWESEAAIRAFAGEDPTRARFYPEDDRFLIRRGEAVQHFEWVHGEGLAWR
jgi:heme-degrading monooxygenase HmoA